MGTKVAGVVKDLYAFVQGCPNERAEDGSSFGVRRESEGLGRGYLGTEVGEKHKSLLEPFDETRAVV